MQLEEKMVSKVYSPPSSEKSAKSNEKKVRYGSIDKSTQKPEDPKERQKSEETKRREVSPIAYRD